MSGPATHWSCCASFPACVPQHLAADRQGTPAMRVPRVIPRLWVAFSVHAHSPGLVPFCVLRATRHSTPCLSPVGRLGLRLGRGHFSVTAKKSGCFPPSEFLIRGYIFPAASRHCHRSHWTTSGMADKALCSTLIYMFDSDFERYLHRCFPAVRHGRAWFLPANRTKWVCPRILNDS